MLRPLTQETAILAVDRTQQGWQNNITLLNHTQQKYMFHYNKSSPLPDYITQSHTEVPPHNTVHAYFVIRN